MQNKILIGLLMILTLAGCEAPQQTSSSSESVETNTENNNATEITQQIFELTNAEREKANLPIFTRNDKLDAAAKKHALDMATNKFLEHTGSDGSKIRDRVEKVAYDWLNLAENIAYNQDSAEKVMAGWMKSEGHRKNILTPALEDIGLAYVETDTGEPYYVQVFGKPNQ